MFAKMVQKWSRERVVKAPNSIIFHFKKVLLWSESKVYYIKRRKGGLRPHSNYFARSAIAICGAMTKPSQKGFQKEYPKAGNTLEDEGS